jgi:hypothetical protein
MFDSITQSADGLFVLLFVIALVVFFLFGPHKIYESLFGSLLGLWLYLLIHEMTFIFPELTRTGFMGNWFVENRWTLLWLSKFLALLLFFVTPMTLWLNVSGVVRGTFWFFLKTVVLSVFFICFWAVLLSLLSTNSWAFSDVAILPKPLKDILYFQNSLFYSWITDKSLIVLVIGFSLWFYKIIFSHWISSIIFFGWVAYMKTSEIFGKRNLDTVIPGGEENHREDNHHSADEHH